MGIVFVWMGQTAPVPLDEDLPAELSDPELTGRRFMRVKVWEANWTEPMAQGIDFHEFYLHRGVNIWRLFNYRLGFFRPKVAYTGGVKITSEGETWVNAAWAAPHFGQGYHPGLGAKWPRRVWWRRLAGGPAVPRRRATPAALPGRPAQRRAAQQDPGDDRREHPPALDGAGHRARHARVDVHPREEAEARAARGLAGALVPRLPQAEHHHRDQRAGRPGRLQARAARISSARRSSARSTSASSTSGATSPGARGTISGSLRPPRRPPRRPRPGGIAPATPALRPRQRPRCEEPRMSRLAGKVVVVTGNEPQHRRGHRRGAGRRGRRRRVRGHRRGRCAAVRRVDQAARGGGARASSATSPTRRRSRRWWRGSARRTAASTCSSTTPASSAG